SGGTILGGILKTTGGQFTVTAPGGTLNGVRVDADLSLIGGANVNNVNNVNVLGTNGLSLNGVVTMAGSSQPTRFVFDGTQTLDGTGEVVLGDVGYNATRLEPINGTLTIGANLKVRGSGVVGSPTLPLVNLGTIISDTSGPGLSLIVTGSA